MADILQFLPRAVAFTEAAAEPCTGDELNPFLCQIDDMTPSQRIVAAVSSALFGPMGGADGQPADTEFMRLIGTLGAISAVTVIDALRAEAQRAAVASGRGPASIPSLFILAAEDGRREITEVLVFTEPECGVRPFKGGRYL